MSIFSYELIPGRGTYKLQKYLKYTSLTEYIRRAKGIHAKIKPKKRKNHSKLILENLNPY